MTKPSPSPTLSRNQRKHRERAERKVAEKAEADRKAKEQADLAAHRAAEAAALKAKQDAAREAEAKAWRDSAWERGIMDKTRARGGAYCGHGEHGRLGPRDRGYHHPHGKPRKREPMSGRAALLMVMALACGW